MVFGVEKLVTSKLHEAGSGQRIFSIDKHVGMVRSSFVLIVKGYNKNCRVLL